MSNCGKKLAYLWLIVFTILIYNQHALHCKCVQEPQLRPSLHYISKIEYAFQLIFNCFIFNTSLDGSF